MVTTHTSSALAASERARSGDEFTVLIIGGGVAALEAALALEELGNGGICVEMICPEAEYTMRPLAVTEPFGAEPPPRLDLHAFCAELGITLRRDRLAELWGRQAISTSSATLG